MRMRHCATCLVLALCVSTVRADVPNLLGWQGVVLDSLDQPITSGEYSMYFAVYSDAVGGDSLWGESQLVMVQDGVANVLLGSSVPLPDTLFDDSLRFLQVQFETNHRTRLASNWSPWASLTGCSPCMAPGEA